MNIRLVGDEYSNDCICEFLELVTSQTKYISDRYSKYSTKELIYLSGLDEDNLPELDSGLLSAALEVFTNIETYRTINTLKVIMHFIYKSSDNGALFIHIAQGFTWYVNPNNILHMIAQHIRNIVDSNEADYGDFLILYMFCIMYECLIVDNLDIVSETHSTEILKYNLSRCVCNINNIEFVLSVLNKNIRSTAEVINEFNGYSY